MAYFPFGSFTNFVFKCIAMIRFYLLLFLFILNIVNFSYAQFSISGTVQSAFDSSGLSQIPVSFHSQSGYNIQTKTDSTGYFNFATPDTIGTIQIICIDYLPFTDSVKGLKQTIFLVEKYLEAKEVSVRGNRFGKRETEVISISILDEKAINNQSRLNSNLNELIGKLSPGVALSNESSSNWGQGIRGRDMLVLIDGIPQSSPVRSSSRELRSIDISAIQQIEVIRGSSALYGHGATGGIINFTTKKPSFKNDTICFLTSASGNSSFVHKKEAYLNSDPAGGRIVQQVTLQKRRFYLIANGAYEHIGKYYDAEGDIIPLDPLGQGGLANTNNYSAFGKAGYRISQASSIEIGSNYYSSEQTPGYIAIAGEYGVKKASARESGQTYPDEKGTATNNLNAFIRYENQNLPGNTQLMLLAFHQDLYARFPYDPASGYFPPVGDKKSAQTFINSNKYGLRVDFKNKIKKASLNYGVDVVSDHTKQFLTDGRLWVPPIQQLNIAPFLQASQTLFKKVTLRGGIRYETVKLSVNDFTTLTTGNSVEGGTLSYDKILLNAGIRYNFKKWFAPYVSFGQGFATTEIGRELRGTGASRVEDLKPKAQVVNNYEFGWNTKIGKRLSINSVGFYNTSEYGVTIIGTAFDVERAPEVIYGYEFESTYQRKKWKLNGSWSYVEGKRDLNLDRNYEEYLSGNRIAPPKATASLEYTFSKRLGCTIQTLYSGNRNRFENQLSGFGAGKVKSFQLFDMIVNYKIWKGNVSVGIYNVLNTFYFPPVSLWANSSLNYVAGRGRTISITYSIEYGL